MELVQGTDFLSYVRGRGGGAADASDATSLMSGPPGVTGDVRTADAPTLPGGPDWPEYAFPVSERALEYDEPRLRAALAQLARGLHALHAIGKVHRDVKPSNLMVTPAGRVVILDFGLVTEARAYGRGAEEYVAGTIAYMAPEQALPEPVGPEADWYAVGVMLYEVLTGYVPHAGTPTEILAAKQRDLPRGPRGVRATVPADLDALCMDLLRVEPAARPRGEEILRRLAVSPAPEVAGSRLGDPDVSARFVGREGELRALREALATARGSRPGRAASVFVTGESGVGKSALVRRFTGQIRDDLPEAIVLAGRCYEGEWVPFKALDGVVDALSAHLASLSREEALAVVPEHAALLAQAFLVLRRVAAFSVARGGPRAAIDPRDQRILVFGALRALLAALAARAPLVVAIDDLQWADADSLALLRELLREPGAPAALFVMTLRARAGEVPGPRAPNELGAQDDGLGDVRRIALAPLPREQARALAEHLVGAGPDDARDEGARGRADAAAFADESGGHPLFLQELVLHHRLHAGSGGPPSFRLDEALWERVRRLDPPAFGLLSAVVLAGGRLSQDVAARAADLGPADYDHHAASLRVASLVRTTGRRGSDAIEPYHDRVREAVSARVEAEERRACHRRLAIAFEAGAPDDHEMLALHWQGAGERTLAADHAVRAAARAEEALAFDRAARLYTLALELGPDAGGASLREKLGEALANAGRGADAAAVFLAAAATASPSEALDLRRRAADQLLRSGHIDEALATFRVVLRAVGVDMPGSAIHALAALLVRRAQVRLRGLGYRERPEARISPEDPSPPASTRAGPPPPASGSSTPSSGSTSSPAAFSSRSTPASPTACSARCRWRPRTPPPRGARPRRAQLASSAAPAPSASGSPARTPSPSRP